MAAKEASEGKFLTLRKNFLPILVSPRVDSIPKPFILTLFVTFFILGSSALTVYLLSIGYLEVLDSATPLPVEGKAIGDCEPVLSRNDFRKRQSFPTNVVGEIRANTDQIESTVVMLIRRPELFEFSQLQLESDQLEGLLASLEAVAEAFDLDVLNNPANDNILAVDSLLNVPFNDLAGRLQALQFVKQTTVVPLEVLDDIVDLFDGTDEVAGSVSPDLLLSVVIEYETDEGANCVVTIQPGDNNQIGGILDATCFVEVEGLDEKVVDLFYTANDNANLFAQLASFMLNMHFAFEEDEQLKDILPGSEFVNKLESTVVIDEILAVSNAFCADRPGLDPVDQFGLISGFFFAFEGLITFLCSLTLFRGKLGLEQGESRRLEKVDVEEIEQDELIGEDEALEEHIVFDTELKKKMYQNKGNKTLNFVDLQRAVFNPRCRTIPHAIPVSTVTFFMLMSFSILAAVAYQDFQTEEQCFSTPLLDANDQECPVTPNIRLFSFEDTENEDDLGGLFAFGSLPLDFSLQISSFDAFNFEDFEVSGSLAEAILAECADQELVAGFCLDEVEGFELDVNNSFEFINGAGGQTEKEFSYTFETDGEIEAELELFVLQTANNDELELKLDIELPGVVFKVASKTVSRDVLSKDFNSTLHASTYIRTFLIKSLLDPEDLVTAVQGTQVRCCRQVSLNFFEYLGITLGYVAIIEGGLTLLVAVSLYSCSSIVGVIW